MKRNIFIAAVCCIFLQVATTVSARQYDGHEVLYFAQQPSSWSWFGNDPFTVGKFAYFYNNDVSGKPAAWAQVCGQGVQYNESSTLYVTVPAGTWTHVILTRMKVTTFTNNSDMWNQLVDGNNQTADIKIPDNGQNYIANFQKKSEGSAWLWQHYLYNLYGNDPTSLSSINGVQKETVEVCTQSLGDPFSLQPKIKSDNSGYDYNGYLHIWYKWDNDKKIWKALHNGDEGSWGFGSGTYDLKETITNVKHTYYYLATTDKSKSRFVDISYTKDCETTCKITNFGVVTSSVNAHDSTFILDGIVAFEDSKGNTLRISVSDDRGEHKLDIKSPSSPCVFSLEGCFASGKTNVTAVAEFINKSTNQPMGGEYRMEAKFNAPNSTTGIEDVSYRVAPGSVPKQKLDPTAVDPSATGTVFVWQDGNTTNKTRDLPQYNFDTVVTYVYYEYEPAPEVAGNLIGNGDFSAPTAFYGSINRFAPSSTKPLKGSKVSEYNYWGMENYDFLPNSTFYDDYKDGDNSISGGMAIVTDANSFWKRFTKKISTKKGTYFALFDADNSGEKKAWYVKTDNSSAYTKNLKIKKGTNYMFSFWVANINNYGEMNNAAKLQFEIKYKTSSGYVTELLGKPTDLNDYLDNLWHQNSFVYTAKVSSDDVQIAVKDLNTNQNPGGNDFALDDIQFSAISVRSQAIKTCVRFTVVYQEDPCEMSALSIKSSPVICGGYDPISAAAGLAEGYTIEFEYTLKPDKKSENVMVTDEVDGVARSCVLPQTYNTTTKKAKVRLHPKSDFGMTDEKDYFDGKTHTFTIRSDKWDDKGTYKGCEISGTYVIPKLPSATMSAIDGVANSFEDYDCSNSTCKVKASIRYINQAGTLYLWFDDDQNNKKAVDASKWTQNSFDEKVVNVEWSGVPGDSALHRLNFSFEDPVTNKGCTGGVYFTTPDIPVLTIASIDVTNPLCKPLPVAGPPQYTYEVTVKYKVESGYQFAIANDYGKYISLNDGTTDYDNILFQPDNSGYAEWHAEYDLTETNGGKDRTIAIKSKTGEGAKDISNRCFADKSYKVPSLPMLRVDTQTVRPACNETTYRATLKLTYQAQNGNLQVRLDDETSTPVIDKATYNETTETLVVNIPADNNQHQVFVRFLGEPCGWSEIVTFPAIYSPKINSVAVSAAPATLNCGSTAGYDITVSVNAENILTGTKIYAETNDGGTVRTESVTVPLAAGATGQVITSGVYDIVFTGLQDANDGQRTVTVYVDGFKATCTNSTQKYTTPLKTGLNDFVPAVKTDRTCTDLTYSIDGTITFDASDGKLIVEDDLGNKKEYTTTGTSQYFEFTGLTADNRHHNIWAYFENDPNCVVNSSVGFDSPTDEIIQSITAVKYEPVCDANRYRVVLTVTADRPHADIVITDGGAEFCRFSAPPMTVAPTAGMTFVKDTMILITGVTHSFEAYIEDMPTCKVQPATGAITDPVKPEMKATAVAGAAQCDGTYIVNINIEYTYQYGTLTYGFVGAAPSTAAITTYSTTKQSVDLPAIKVDADGNPHNLYIQIDGTGCDTTILLPAVSAPQVSIDRIDVSAAACDNPAYSIELTVTETNTTGAMTLTVDGKAATYTKNAAGRYVVSGLTSAGKKAVAVTASWAAHGCTANLTYDEPVVPHLGDATITTTTLVCGETTYSLTLSIPFANMAGAMVVTDNSVELANTDTVVRSPFVHTFTGLSADGGSHNLAVQFGGCTVNTAYTAPTMPICNVIKDTICFDDWKTYDKNGFTLTTQPAVGENRYAKGFDSLYLYVEQMPELQLSTTSLKRECEDVSEVRVPITGTPVEVGTLVATVDNVSAKAVIEGQEVVILLPAGLKAADYKVTVEALNPSGRCVSEKTEFTITLAHKGLLYRKWDDVVFVSNKDSLFAEYQWYKNGVALEGETQQRLYDPNGLSGSFYCEMTTVSGEKWYTCEEDFDGIQRSADLSNGNDASVSPNPVRASQVLTVSRSTDETADVLIYDATGRLVMKQQVSGIKSELTAPDTAGMYMLRVDGQTLKLVVR